MADTKTVPNSVTKTVPKAVPLPRMLADLWRTLRRDACGSYRPDLHYMRGPGPKWREKHGVTARTEPDLTGAMGAATSLF